MNRKIRMIKNSVEDAERLAQALLFSSKTPVFDLDGVLLDASHRIKLNDDGSLDLDHYRANTTAEQVAQDKTLPLMLCIDSLNKYGKPYHVATARVLCEHTLAKLAACGIEPVLALGREGEGDRRKDAELKGERLRDSFSPLELSQMVLIDDHIPNCQAALALGMQAVAVERCTKA